MSKLLTLYGRDATPPPVPVPPLWAYKFDLLSPTLTEPPPDLLTGFSRSGPAWMFDSSGQIVLVPENWQAYSGDVARLESNHVTFENTTATSVLLRVTAQYPYLFSNAGYRSELVAGKRFFASCTIKVFQAGKVGRIGFYRPTAAATEIQVDMDTGDVIFTDGTPGHILVERLGEWHYRVCLSWVSPDANNGWYAFFGLSGAPVGTQFELSDMAVTLHGHCAFVPVADTVPIKDRPRWNAAQADGSRGGWTVEKDDTENPVLWSENYNDPDSWWTRDNITAAPEPDEWAPRKGKAHRIAADGTDNVHRLTGAFMPTSYQYPGTFSTIVKAGDGWIQLVIYDDTAGAVAAWANFNPATGETGNSNAGVTLTALANGWVFAQISCTPSATTDYHLNILPISGDVPNYYTSEITSAWFLLCHMQFERNSPATMPVPTDGAAVTRGAETLRPDALWKTGSDITLLAVFAAMPSYWTWGTRGFDDDNGTYTRQNTGVDYPRRVLNVSGALLATIALPDSYVCAEALAMSQTTDSVAMGRGDLNDTVTEPSALLLTNTSSSLQLNDGIGFFLRFFAIAYRRLTNEELAEEIGKIDMRRAVPYDAHTV